VTSPATTASRWDQVRAAGGADAGRNLVARVAALAALTLSSLLVARTLGPAGVAAFSLLRVLPWLVGVLLGGGLYGAAPYFLSGPRRSDPAYRSTFPAMAVVAGVVGTWLWVAGAPFLHGWLFPQMTVTLLALAGVTVLTQLVESTAKACSQGTGDLRGANRIIVLEELCFAPLYGGLLLAGVGHYPAMVVGLVGGDLVTGGQGWARLRRRGFFAGSRPDLAHARRIVGFGIRAEAGSIALLLNARLDFAIVGSLVGPSALGVYAVASRYAELLRLPGLALNYVLYPAYAHAGGSASAVDARDAARRIGWVPPLLAVPMVLLAPVVLPLAFGPQFRGAVVPAWILLAGLSGSGLVAIFAAYLTGNARPGLVSAAFGAGLVVTVTLDLLLIPRHGVVGAAWASTAAYLVTTAVVLACFHAVARHAGTPTARRPPAPDVVADRGPREVLP
jgi:O-antigen/teichoic acid export membrane protein